MPKVKTAISIDYDLLVETNSLAEEMDVPRSQIVSEALEEYIRLYHNRKLFHQINEAYADYPDPDEQGTLKIIQSHRKKPGALDEWK
jgi:metal-responsive CopG/Arc/MetJ family transcriptional regulator